MEMDSCRKREFQLNRISVFLFKDAKYVCSMALIVVKCVIAILTVFSLFFVKFNQKTVFDVVALQFIFQTIRETQCTNK